MKSGVLQECDTPAQLLRNGLNGTPSLFFDMIQQSGDSNVQKMLHIAEQAEMNSKQGMNSMLQPSEKIRQLSGQSN